MFANRSTQKELLDLGPPHYTFAEYANCMEKLFSINRLLGIFRHTKSILNGFDKKSHVLDIGCGNGAFLLNLSHHFPMMRMQGIEINSMALELAEGNLRIWQKKNLSTNVSFHMQDKNLPENYVDIILLTLVCHHLTDAELIEFLKEMLNACNKAVIINDLHRHPLAYFFYKWLSPNLFKNRLITHDGLISIKRSFVREDWLRILSAAGIKNFEVKWCFPFRWSVILWKK